MKYAMNSSVIPNPGIYEYTTVDAEFVRQWYSPDVVSAIGYEPTARLLSQLTGCDVPVARISVFMETGDEALVVKMKTRVDPTQKGQIEVSLDDVELGILSRKG